MGSGWGLGWGLVGLVGGWPVGGCIFMEFFVLCLCFYFFAFYFDPCFWYDTFFLDYEVDASFFSFLFCSFPFLRFHFVSFQPISFRFINMGTSGVTLMGAEVLYLSSCCYVFLSSFFISPLLSFLLSVFNF